MTATTLSLPPGAKEYYIQFDGNPKPSTHPQIDCWDFAYQNGVPLWMKMRISAQAKGFVHIDDGKQISSIDEEVGDDGAEESEEGEVENEVEKTASRMIKVEEWKGVDLDERPNLDTREGRDGTPGENNEHGKLGDESEKQQASPEETVDKDVEQYGARAWIRSWFSGWS